MFNIPTVTKNLLIINTLAFLAMLVLRSTSIFGAPIDLNDICGLHFFMASDFHIYQFVTYLFMHSAVRYDHIIFNMFALWMFGCVVERVWGPKKFLFYYISCGIGAGLFQELAQYVEISMILSQANRTFATVPEYWLNGLTTVGASGSIYAILLAFGMIFPNERMFIFPLPIPIKAKFFVIGYAVIELVSAMASSGDSVAHFAHLGGMFFGFFMIRYWNKHPDQGYGMNPGRDAFDKMKNFFGGNRVNHKEHRSTGTTPNFGTGNRQSDWEYNAQKKKEQEEVDRILDKIRKSGYESLTKAEKQKLFDQSKK